MTLRLSLAAQQEASTHMRFTRTASLFGLLLTLLFSVAGSTQQRSPRPASDGDWAMYRHDLAGTGYSALGEITAKNVASLTRVWTYKLQSDAPAAAPGGRGGAGGVNSEATPIVVNGVMYLPA